MIRFHSNSEILYTKIQPYAEGYFTELLPGLVRLLYT